MVIKLIFKKVWRKEIVCKTLNWCLLSYGSNFDVMIFFEKMVWKKIFLINVFIDVCFSRGQNWMLRFLRKWCEKKIGYFLSKNVFALLGSKFDVRIFEKGVWERNLINKFICSSWVQSLMSEFLRKGCERKINFIKNSCS